MTAESSTELIRSSSSEEMRAHSEAILARHARSFRLASLFLADQERLDAAVLYAICRLVDDTADECDDKTRAGIQLDGLRDELVQKRYPRPLVAEFLEVADRCELDVAVMLELIEGVESDLEEVIVADDGELYRYCYRVAGTVGLMMCSVLGVRDPKALAFAIDLGMGMQLTNICRDVLEDARRGRVYVPRTRLEAAGITAEDLLREDVDEEALSRVVRGLLDQADAFYFSADQGMQFIPWRSRLAIVVASRVYRAIGVKLRKKGARVMQGRTVVSSFGKAMWVVRALFLWVMVSPPFAPRGPKHQRELHQELRGLPGVEA